LRYRVGAMRRWCRQALRWSCVWRYTVVCKVDCLHAIAIAIAVAVELGPNADSAVASL
jgi:hypothetical protein